MFNNRFIILFLLFNLTGCGYNDLQYGDEIATSKWAELLSQYQQRADLVPNLVSAVKGQAPKENEVLLAATEAVAKAGPIPADPEQVPDEAAFKQFVEGQSQVAAAVARLLAVADGYPGLKKDAVFRDVRARLEGIEKRIGVASSRYSEAVNHYNQLVGSVPSSLTAVFLGLASKPNFAVEKEAGTFVTPEAAPAAPVTKP